MLMSKPVLNETEIKVSELSELNVKYNVSVNINAVKQLLETVDSFFAQKLIHSPLKTKIRAVLYEAAINVVQHSGMSSTRKFTIDICLNTDSVQLIICSGGKRFDSEKEALLSKSTSIGPPYMKRGYGLKSIVALVDSLKYKRTRNGMNELVLTFNKD